MQPWPDEQREASAPRVRPLVGALAVVMLVAAGLAETRAAAIQVADSGELVAVACNRGVAHPPGFPLYTLAGHAFCRLPWSTPAARLALLSVLAMLLAVASLFGLVRRVSGSAAAAAVATLAFALAPLPWRYGGMPEVFALHLALTLGCLYTALAAQQALRRGWRSGGLVIAALLFGLALSHHPTALLVLPLLLAAAAYTPGWRGSAGLLRASGMFGALAVGLLPYLHLLLAPLTALPRWGETQRWAGLLHHVLRRDYGTWQLVLGERSGPGSTLRAFAAALPAQLGWLVAWLALVGTVVLLVHGLRRRGAGLPVPRGLALLLAGAPVWCGPLFFLLFNADARGIGRQVVERFFLLPLALLALPGGVAIAWLSRRWLRPPAAPASADARWRRYLLAAGLSALVASRAVLGLPGAHLRDSYAVEDYALNVLGIAAGDALILGEGDVRLFALTHAQQVLGARPDVQYVDVRLLLYPWYVAQQRRRFPQFAYQHRTGHVDSLGLIRRSLAAGRPVYLAWVYSPQVAAAFPSYPVGPLRRLLLPGQPLPSLATVVALNRRFTEAAVRRGRDPDPGLDPWSASLREPWAWTWYALGRALESAGDRGGAAQARAAARAWAPWLRPPPVAAPGPRPTPAG